MQLKTLIRPLLPQRCVNLLKDIYYAPLRKNILSCLKQYDDIEIQEIVAFLKSHGASKMLFPYDFPMKYVAERIAVYRDDTGFPYVIHNGRRLYGKKNLTDKQFKICYNALLIEQDEESPHRYLFPDRMPSESDVVADIGAAEGIFTLDVIEHISHAYLFEYDTAWVEALKLTFKPEIESGKVEIIESFVGKNDDETGMVSLDSFFKDKQIDYVKADIEGSEEDMLLGGKTIFREKISKALLCLYHKQNAETTITSCLHDYDFETIVNKGYMLWIASKELTGVPLVPPYIRRGVVYAKKKAICAESAVLFQNKQ